MLLTTSAVLPIVFGSYYRELMGPIFLVIYEIHGPIDINFC